MKKFWIYILVTFGMGWLCQGLGILSLDHDPTGLVYTGLLTLCMFAPLFGTLAANGGIGRKADIRWKPRIKGRARWWLAAWFIPAALTLLGAAVFFLLFPSHFDASAPMVAEQIAAQGLPIPTFVIVLAAVVQCLTYAPFINMFFALGEEVGWRGWMTPFLTEKLGQTKALVLSGVIWGAWHWPVILLAGYNFGFGYWGAPFTGALEMCLACIALGILLSFLYEKTRSVWAPALAHGAFNATAGIGSYFLPTGTTAMILGPTPLGLIAGIPLFALAAWAFFRKTKEEKPMMLETERLLLRPWREEDAADLYEYAQNPAVGPAAGWPVHTSVENSRDIIQNVLSAPETYAVVLKATGKPVGSAGIKFTPNTSTSLPPNEAELGYWVGVPHWGQGYIPEAVRELLRRCFEDLGCAAVWCAYYDGNEKSRRVQEKCGFRYHHTEENKPCLLLNTVHTEHFTRISKNEWAQRSN